MTARAGRSLAAMTPRPRLLLLATVALVAVGCASPTPSDVADDGAATTAAPGSVATVPAPGDISAARLAPLEGLGACASPPTAPAGVVVPDDLPLPEGVVVSVAEEAGGLLSLQGYVPLTPVQVLVDYLDVEGWDVVQAEDEVFEAEVLLVDGDRRFYVKTQAVCSQGSAFVGFVSEDVPVPTPTGGASSR